MKQRLTAVVEKNQGLEEARAILQAGKRQSSPCAVFRKTKAFNMSSFCRFTVSESTPVVNFHANS